MRRIAGSQWHEVTFGLISVGTVLVVATTASTFISAPELAAASPLPTAQRTAAGFRLILYGMAFVSLVAYMFALLSAVQVPFQTTLELKKRKCKTVAACIRLQAGTVIFAAFAVLVILAMLDAPKILLSN